MMTVRGILNPPSERPHILLTASLPCTRLSIRTCAITLIKAIIFIGVATLMACID